MVSLPGSIESIKLPKKVIDIFVILRSSDSRQPWWHHKECHSYNTKFNHWWTIFAKRSTLKRTTIGTTLTRHNASLYTSRHQGLILNDFYFTEDPSESYLLKHSDAVDCDEIRRHKHFVMFSYLRTRTATDVCTVHYEGGHNRFPIATTKFWKLLFAGTANKIAQHPTKVAQNGLKHVKFILFFFGGGATVHIWVGTAPLALVRLDLSAGPWTLPYVTWYPKQETPRCVA